MQTRFRTLLLAGAASLAMSGAALAQGVTIDGIPATKQGVMKITCTDLNNGAAQPCFVALSSGGSAVSTSNRFPVNADGSTVTANQGAAGAGEWLVRDGTDGPGTNPGTGARGWLSGIAASNGAINTATGTQADAATASGANTSIIGALRAIRDRVLGVLSAQLTQGGTAVSATNPTFAQVTNLGASLPNAYTSTPLAASGAYTGAAYNTGILANGANIYPYAYFACSAYADQAGTLFIESSTDGTNFFPRNGTAGQALTAGSNLDVKVPLSMNVLRCRFVNGATAQTKFFLTGEATRY